MRFDILSYLVFLMTASFPLYIFGNGSIQPSHALAIVAMIYCLAYNRLTFGVAESILIALITLMLFTEVVYVHDILGINPILTIAFTVFTLLFVATFRKVLLSRHIEVFYGIFVSQLVAWIGLLIYGFSFTGSEATRALGFFNNPNQLGYFAVLSFSIAVLIRMLVVVDKRIYIFIILCSIIFAILSLSKAAMISLAVGLLLLAYSHSPSKFVLLIFPALPILIGSLSLPIMEKLNFVIRLSNIGQANDDSLSARGTFILFQESKNAFDYIFGIGVDRAFIAADHEIHSTFFSFLSYYGILGFSLYSSFFGYVAYQLSKIVSFKYVLVILTPPLLYGLTHNGSRALFYMLLISLILASANQKFKNINKDRLIRYE